MHDIAIIGLDLAKNVFQVHCADSRGTPVLRRKLRRGALLDFFRTVPTCLVAMEACGGAHHWARELKSLGHDVRLIAPAYVKPFRKRQKSDAADAEAICEAAQRPTMRFVAIKTREAQSSALLFKARELLIRQRTQTINALRGHMTEFGLIAAKGPSHTARLAAFLETSPEAIPVSARPVLEMLLQHIEKLNDQIECLNTEIEAAVEIDEAARRLMTIPGVGTITAAAISALAPAASLFRSGRDFAAWVGLTPLQNSTGGKERLGRTSRMGERSIRRLLIIGASAVARWAAKRGVSPDSWLGRMLTRKPPMLVRVALANKMARICWALLAHGGTYRVSAPAT